MRLKRLILAALNEQLAGGRARPPEGGAIIWQAFNQLSRQRTWHANGPNPIGWSEIEAYCRLMRLPLEPQHIAIVMDMDRLWLEHVLISMRREAPKPKPVSSAPMTPELFDAMWG